MTNRFRFGGSRVKAALMLIGCFWFCIPGEGSIVVGNALSCPSTQGDPWGKDLPILDWEHRPSVQRLYLHLNLAGKFWREYDADHPEAGEKIVSNLLIVASSSDTLSIAGAARRWYREGDMPSWLLLSMLESLVFVRSSSQSEQLPYWNISNGKLRIPFSGREPKMSFIIGVLPMWRVIYDPFYRRVDISRFRSQIQESDMCPTRIVERLLGPINVNPKGYSASFFYE